jgi:hypothetical protein
MHGTITIRLCRPSFSATADSARRNKLGKVDFKERPWTADQVMASDPRIMLITLMSVPEGADPSVGNISHHDPTFLGEVRVQLAQIWQLLPAGAAEYTCNLQLKLGPCNLPQCTGSVVVRVQVKPLGTEAYFQGVQYAR